MNNNNGRGYNHSGYSHQGYRQGGYQQGGYRQQSGYNQGGFSQQRQQPQKKHSGAKTKKYTPTSGPNAGTVQIHTHGWYFRKGVGLITFSCNTTQKSKLGEKGWIGSIAVEMVNKKTFQKSFHWGTMEASTGKVVIDDLQIVINPRGGKGGFTGSYINR